MPGYQKSFGWMHHLKILLPIYGMPILDVDLAKQVIVIKRSMSPGYAGIANPLFINDTAKMLFADAKEGLENIIKSFQLV